MIPANFGCEHICTAGLHGALVDARGELGLVLCRRGAAPPPPQFGARKKQAARSSIHPSAASSLVAASILISG
jgi:hypothetical protein